MKKKTSIILIVLQTILILIELNINAYAQENQCQEITDSIEYFTASLFDYNNIEFNEKARNMTQDEFNSLPIQEKHNTDKKHTLFGNAGFMWDRWHGKNASMYGGIQNGTMLQNGQAVAIPYESSVLRGIIHNKLTNNNITLKYSNNNDTVFFPTEAQAENKGLVGDNKPYQEILRNYKIPFIKEPSGYYYMDSNKYHYKKSNDNKFKLHTGTVGGLSEWDTRTIGFFPFNKDCYKDSNTKQRNNLYFGMRIDVDFYMTEDGKSYNPEAQQLEDMIFEFTGDDDIWIFIDDTLILDLGGPSFTTTSGSINFAKNQTYTESVTDSNLNIIKDVYEKNIFGEKILSKGEHKLTVFYLERFGGSANFRMRFNLPKKDELIQYTGTKEWKDDNNSQKLRPQNYTLKLYADGKYLKSKNFTSTNWVFEGLPKKNRNTNKEIIYHVEEDEIILENGDKYIPTIKQNQVVNTLTGTNKMEVQKIWEDSKNKNKTRPNNITITIRKILGR